MNFSYWGKYGTCTKRLLVNLFFYVGCVLGYFLVFILSLINVFLFSPFYLYNKKQFFRIQLYIVMIGFTNISIKLNPYITYENESDEDIPKGPVIFAFNHLSNADTFIISSLLDTHFCFIYKDSLHKIPLCGLFLPSTGSIPVRFKYENDKKIVISDTVAEMFATCKSRIDSGISIIVFPEGARSENGKLGEFKNGFFRFALEHDISIVPCAIQGTNTIFPKFSIILNPGHASIRIGKPIRPSDILGIDSLKSKQGQAEKKIDLKNIEKLRDHVRLEIYKLSKQFSSFSTEHIVPELEQYLKK